MSQSAVGEEGAAAPFDASTPDFSEIRDWFALLKPRVMTLVVFTGFIGMLVAPGSINPLLGSVAVLCIAVGAGAAGAINMWYDRDIDAVMRRTANRPIPAGRIRAEEALAFGVVLAIASVVVMGLKRRTPQNIVIGGAAGAFPPVIGWAAVTGSVDLLPLLLFAIVFAWTPPHFWSLSLWAHGDYQRAGVPMLPVVAGAKETRRQIMLYTLVLFPLAVSPWPLGLAGPVYGVAAVLLGLGFVFCAWKVLRDDQDPQGRSLTKDAPAKRCFRFSLLHLALLFAALAADRLILG